MARAAAALQATAAAATLKTHAVNSQPDANLSSTKGGAMSLRSSAARAGPAVATFGRIYIAGSGLRKGSPVSPPKTQAFSPHAAPPERKSSMSLFAHSQQLCRTLLPSPNAPLPPLRAFCWGNSFQEIRQPLQDSALKNPHQLTRPRKLALVASVSAAAAASDDTGSAGGLAVSSGVRTASAAGPPAADKVRNLHPVDLNPPRGTRDFPPQEMRLRKWLFGQFREVSELFAFEEVDFPVLESEELFVRKAGEEITQQLYNFEDKGGRRMALRPELTPSLARLVLQKGKSLSLPLKWFAIGQCWRYERMTRGRRREHYQWNMDIMGVPGVEAEAELLSAITTFFSRVGLSSKDVGIRVSNRKLLQAVIEQHGVAPESFAAVCVVVDKIEKIPRVEVERELAAVGVSAEASEGILKAMSMRRLEELEETLGASTPAVIELKRLFLLAESYGFADWLVFDASVVRGLAYYTGTVFEAFDRDGKLRAICGGGRYDRLLSTYGGADTPACGFGFGDAVIVELLKEKNLLPDPKMLVDDIIIPVDASLRPRALELASRLRSRGRKVDLVLEDSKRLKWAFKQAERVGAQKMIILGENEFQRGMVKVKDLMAREEMEVPFSDV